MDDFLSPISSQMISISPPTQIDAFFLFKKERRYFLQLLGIGARKKGSKGPAGREGGSGAKTPEKRRSVKGSRAKGRKEEKRKTLRWRERRENADCLIPRLNSKKAGNNAAQKLDPLEAAVHLKAGT